MENSHLDSRPQRLDEQQQAEMCSVFHDASVYLFGNLFETQAVPAGEFLVTQSIDNVDYEIRSQIVKDENSKFGKAVSYELSVTSEIGEFCISDYSLYERRIFTLDVETGRGRSYVEHFIYNDLNEETVYLHDFRPVIDDDITLTPSESKKYDRRNAYVVDEVTIEDFSDLKNYLKEFILAKQDDEYL